MKRLTPRIFSLFVGLVLAALPILSACDGCGEQEPNVPDPQVVPEEESPAGQNPEGTSDDSIEESSPSH